MRFAFYSWRSLTIFLTLLGASLAAWAFEPVPDAVLVRVADVGPALCAVAVIPGNHFVIYDAGNYKDKGKQTFSKIEELIPFGSEVDLLVLSHSDSDHLGAVKEICEAYTVKKIVHSGRHRSSATWQEADTAIQKEKKEGCTEVNLHDQDLPVGETENLGEASLTWVFGFSEPPKDWITRYKLKDDEQMNVGSIVARLGFHGKHILFCGDLVGRHRDDPPGTCIAGERAIVDNLENIPIRSEVLIAPHHGADNASSEDFIDAVGPQYVVFAAGHDTTFQHPRATTAQRYIHQGISVDHIFRTDLGDDDGDKEWSYGRIANSKDPAGDDDVDILLKKDGEIRVQYRTPHNDGK